MDDASAARPQKEIVDFIDLIKPFYMEEGDYRRSNDYNDIRDSETREQIESFCRYDCSSETCGRLGAKKKIGVGSQVMWPRSKIASCLSKV